MSRRLLVPTCLLLFGLAPERLAAQSYAVQVWDQLQEHWKTISKNDDDWYLQNYLMGRLNKGGTDSWTFYFDKGKSYIITGACDNDCGNVDLVIKDADGNTVDKDRKDDDTPVLTLQPEKAGRYTINVEMAACKEEPCYFGLGMLLKWRRSSERHRALDQADVGEGLGEVAEELAGQGIDLVGVEAEVVGVAEHAV